MICANCERYELRERRCEVCGHTFTYCPYCDMSSQTCPLCSGARLVGMRRLDARENVSWPFWKGYEPN
jgi:hypothetical protein